MIYYRLFILLAIELFLVSCQSHPVQEKPVLTKEADIQVIDAPVAPVAPKPKVAPVQKTAKLPVKKVETTCKTAKPTVIIKHNLPVIGRIEKAAIMPAGLLLKARIDTGATSSSIGVEKLENYERDGKPWVKFFIKDPKTGKSKKFNLKREKIVRIKQHETAGVKRPVIKLRVIIGKIDQIREFTLTKRNKSDYPVLIGRNYLMDSAIVDVSHKYTVQTRIPKK